jgi:hypothetical protein
VRIEGPDGQPLTEVTIHCGGEDDAAWVVRTLRGYLDALEQISAPGSRGEITWRWASGEGEVGLHWVCGER